MLLFRNIINIKSNNRIKSKLNLSMIKFIIYTTHDITIEKGEEIDEEILLHT